MTRGRWLRGGGIALALAVNGLLTGRVAAQDTTRVGRDSASVVPPVAVPTPRPPGADSAGGSKPPVSPMGAMWRSILIPGWGQARLNRKLTGALFVTWEGVTLGMSIKTSQELRYMQRTNSAGVGAKRKEKQDWLVLLAFNHLFSAIEAYVSAHLWDFPQDLEIRAAPVPGGVGASVRLPIRIP